MLVNTIDDFVKVIPTATGTEYSVIEPFLYEADNKFLGQLLGTDLYNYIESLGATNALKLTYIRLLSFQAYENAIPFADLIQTQNGFGVVSNSNIAPASKERVERLREWVSKQIYVNVDLLIQLIYQSTAAMTEWRKFAGFNSLTDCFFLTGEEFSNYTPCQDPKRKYFLDKKSELLAWQTNIIEKLISKGYLSQLIAEMRAVNFTAGSENVIRHCKIILGLLSQGNQEQALKTSNVLSNMLDDNLTTYITYAASPEYALRKTPVYENKLNDPTYFFG